VCFSESASLVSGVAITGVGVATLRMVPDRRQLPFAALPLIFGVHQVLEGVVWRQLEQSAHVAVRTPAVELWLLIAWLVLPIWVPLAVRWFEPDAETAVRISGHHLVYTLPVEPGWPLAIPYVAATCLAMILSSHRFVVAFGLALLGSLAVTALMDARALSSVWCFFAALLSVSLFIHYARPRLTVLASDAS
jgi:hypothetical protein